MRDFRVGTVLMRIFENEQVLFETVSGHVFISDSEMDEICRQWKKRKL